MNCITVEIETSQNLLGFSGGIDSSALFFILLEQNIPFDIAIVDYGQREQSKDEVIYATQLAHKYQKKCFISTYPKDKKFSENSAREYRYEFFEEIIEKDNYDALITAHQLNDKLEWFLMQLTKGAGVTELVGMEKKNQKESYTLLKPLLEYSKKTLQNYLDQNSLKYFIDSSNYDEKYTRNFFRHNFSNELLEKYETGIANSFRYLERDNNSLLANIKTSKIEELSIYEYNGDKNIALRMIDKDLKKRGIIISNATRDEIVKRKELVVAHKIAVSLDDKKIYLAPKVDMVMTKDFKERCRKEKIPQNIRTYLFFLEQQQIFTL